MNEIKGRLLRFFLSDITFFIVEEGYLCLFKLKSFASPDIFIIFSLYLLFIFHILFCFYYDKNGLFFKNVIICKYAFNKIIIIFSDV